MHDLRFTSDEQSSSPEIEDNQDNQPSERRMILIPRQGETRLVETLSDITDHREQWQLLVYNLSELLDEYKSDYQLRIAMNLANDLLQPLDGGIYLCANGDMAVLVHNLNPQVERKLTFQLRYLYMDDPLAYDTQGNENEDFSVHYTLDRDFDECFSRFSKQMVQAERGGKVVARPAGKMAGVKENVMQMLNASRMASVESQLARVDVSQAFRNQAICVRTGAGQFRTVFEEVYIHIPHLRDLLSTDVDFLSNPWLFKYLTQLLDMRMLDMLGKQKQTLLAAPVSINVNATTLLSNEFLEFDSMLDAPQKVAVVFEIPVVDAFADTYAFQAACKQAQSRGYRVCLDGLNDINLLQMSAEAFGVDLIKLQWNAQENVDEQDKLRQVIERIRSKRVILCRCDNQDAIEYGRGLGISLFQGRWLDQQMKPDQAQVN